MKSVAIIPGPPALVTIATRLLTGNRLYATSLTISKSSSEFSALIRLPFSIAARVVSYDVANDPVCDAIACFAFSEHPGATMTMGLEDL